MGTLEMRAKMRAKRAAPLSTQQAMRVARSRELIPRQLIRQESVVNAYRDLFAETLKQPPSLPVPTKGRGIVTMAGGPKYFPLGFFLVAWLRELGCKLPIQMWCLGSHEIDWHMRDLLRPYDVEVIDASVAIPAKQHPKVWSGWEITALALSYSGFEQVLFIDADNFPIHDPTYLFDSPWMKEQGLALWPDLEHTAAYDVSPEALHVAGIEPFGDEHIEEVHGVDRYVSGYQPTESGQILIDVGRHAKLLQMANHINHHSDFWYPRPVSQRDHIIYGDKTSFLLASLATNTEYAKPKVTDWTVCETGGFLTQYDHNDKPVFQHYCQPQSKLMLDSKHKAPPELQASTFIDTQMKSLKQQWSGKVRTAPTWWNFGTDASSGHSVWDRVVTRNVYTTDSLQGKVVVDIGSHVGSFAELAIERGAKTVVAFEPDHENFAALVHNTNRYNSRVRVFPAAVVCKQRESTTMFTPGEDASRTGGIASDEGGKGAYGVLTITLSGIKKLLGKERCALLKLNCNGSEACLLRSDNLAWVDAVVVGTEGIEAKEAEDVLRAKGFDDIEVCRAEGEASVVHAKRGKPENHKPVLPTSNEVITECMYRGENIGKLNCSCRSSPLVYLCTNHDVSNGYCTLQTQSAPKNKMIYLLSGEQIPYDGAAQLTGCARCPYQELKST